VILVTLALAFGIMWIAAPARAIDLDGITLTPFASYTGEYDDNVFRGPRGNRKDDYINTLSAGVNVEAKPERRHEVNAGYKFDQLWYSNNNNLDAQRHLAFLNFVLNFNRAQFRFGEQFRRTNEFPTSEFTQYIPRNENILGAGFDFDMAQIWGIGFDYTWDHNNYLDTSLDNLDRNRHTIAPNLYYKLSGKTRVFLEYNFAREVYDSDKTRDNSDHRVLVGFRGDLADRFSLTGKIGWQGLYYTATVFEDSNSFIFDIKAEYQPLERLSFMLNLKRYTEPSVFGPNGHYDYMPFILAATYNMTPKIALIPRVSLGWAHYKEEVANPSAGNNPESRDDLDMGAGFSIRWDPVKWARVEVGYDFTSRNSNFNAFEYLDNRVFFTIGGQM
jgi:hypothetical protein